jgi:hypothetical protein
LARNSAATIGSDSRPKEKAILQALSTAHDLASKAALAVFEKERVGAESSDKTLATLVD